MAIDYKKRSIFSLTDFRGLDSENKKIKVAPFRATEGKNFVIDSNVLKTRPGLEFAKTFGFIPSNDKLIDFFVKDNFEIIFTEKDIIINDTNENTKVSLITNNFRAKGTEILKNVSGLYNPKGRKPIIREEKEVFFIFGLRRIYVLSLFIADDRIAYVAFYDLKEGKRKFEFSEENVNAQKWYEKLPAVYEPTIAIGNNILDDPNLLSKVSKYKLFAHNKEKTVEAYNVLKMPTHYDPSKHGEFKDLLVNIDFYKNNDIKYKSYQDISKENEFLGFPVFLGISDFNYFPSSVDYGEIINEDSPYEIKERFSVKEDFEYILYPIEFQPENETHEMDASDYDIKIGEGLKARYFWREVSKQEISITPDEFFKMLYEDIVVEADDSRTKRVITVFEHVIEVIGNEGIFDENYRIRYEIPYRAKTRYIDYDKGLTLETGILEDVIFVDVQYRVKEEIKYNLVYEKKEEDDLGVYTTQGTYDAQNFPEPNSEHKPYTTINYYPYPSSEVSENKPEAIKAKVSQYIENHLKEIESSFGETETELKINYGIKTQYTDRENNRFIDEEISFNPIQKLESIAVGEFDSNEAFNEIADVKRDDNDSSNILRFNNIDFSKISEIQDLNTTEQNTILEAIKARRKALYDLWISTSDTNEISSLNDRDFLTKHYLYNIKNIPATPAIAQKNSENLFASTQGGYSGLTWLDFEKLGLDKSLISDYSPLNFGANDQVVNATKTIRINKTTDGDYYNVGEKPSENKIRTILSNRISGLFPLGKVWFDQNGKFIETPNLLTGRNQKLFTDNYLYYETKETKNVDAENITYNLNTIETEVSEEWKPLENEFDTDFPDVIGNIQFDFVNSLNKKVGNVKEVAYSPSDDEIKAEIKNTMNNALINENPTTIQVTENQGVYYAKQNFRAKVVTPRVPEELPEDTFEIDSIFSKSNVVNSNNKPSVATMKNYPIASPQGQKFDTDIVTSKTSPAYTDSEYIAQVKNEMASTLASKKNSLEKGLNKKVYLKTYATTTIPSTPESYTLHSTTHRNLLTFNNATTIGNQAIYPKPTMTGHDVSYAYEENFSLRTSAFNETEIKAQAKDKAKNLINSKRADGTLPFGNNINVAVKTYHYKKRTVAGAPELFSSPLADVTTRDGLLDMLYKSIPKNINADLPTTTDKNFLNDANRKPSYLPELFMSASEFPSGAFIDRNNVWTNNDVSRVRTIGNSMQWVTVNPDNALYMLHKHDIAPRYEGIINYLKMRLLALKSQGKLPQGINKKVYVQVYTAYPKNNFWGNFDGYLYFTEVYEIPYTYVEKQPDTTVYDLYSVRTDVNYSFSPSESATYEARSYYIGVDYDYVDEIPEITKWYGKTAESKISFATDGWTNEIIKSYGVSIGTETNYTLVESEEAKEEIYGTTVVIKTNFIYNNATYTNRLLIYPITFTKESENQTGNSITIKDLYDFYYNERSKTFDLKIKNYFYDFNNEPSIDVKIVFKNNADYEKIENSKLGVGFGTENRLILASGIEKEANIDYYNVSNNLLGNGDISQSYEHTYFPSKNFRVVGDKTRINGYIVSNDSHLFITKDSKNFNDKLYVRERIMDEKGLVRYQETRTNVNKTAINKNAIVQFNNDIVLLDETGLYGIELAENIQTDERLTRLRSPFINEELKKAIKQTVRENIFIYEDNYLMFIVLGKVIYVADSRYFAKNEDGEVNNVGYEFVKWEFDNVIEEVKRVEEEIYLIDSNKTLYKLKDEKGFDEKAKHIHSGMSGIIDNSFVSDSYLKIKTVGLPLQVMLPNDMNKYEVEIYGEQDIYRKINANFTVDNRKLIFAEEDLNKLYGLENEMEVYVLETNNNVLKKYNVNDISLDGYFIELNNTIDNFKELYIKDDKLYKFAEYSTNEKTYTLKKREETEPITLLVSNALSTTFDIIMYENKPIRIEWVSAILDFGNSMFEKTLFKTFVKGRRQNLGTELSVGLTTMKRRDLYDAVERKRDIESLIDFSAFDFNLFSIAHFEEFGIQISTKENNFLYIQVKIQADGSIEINGIDFLYKNNRMLKTF